MQKAKIRIFPFVFLENYFVFQKVQKCINTVIAIECPDYLSLTIACKTDTPKNGINTLTLHKHPKTSSIPEHCIITRIMHKHPKNASTP